MVSRPKCRDQKWIFDYILLKIRFLFPWHESEKWTTNETFITSIKDSNIPHARNDTEHFTKHM